MAFAYDARGKVVEQIFFDDDGKPKRQKYGIAKITRAYDAWGNEIEKNYFDEEGKPTRSTDGYAKVTKSYDARGSEVEKAYFDEKGIAVHEPLGPGVSSSATVSTP